MQPKSIQGGTSIGATTTDIVYRNPSVDNPSVETSLKSTSGSILSRELQVYDRFARPNRHILRRPAGNASHTETEQKTFYNALSWVTKVTTRQTGAATALATSGRSATIATSTTRPAGCSQAPLSMQGSVGRKSTPTILRTTS